ncbi:MAG TPA: HAMP domain-containing sensor histidine kinase [Rugosimonospora sp.]
MQLTLLYAVPFFISGTALLALSLAGLKDTAPANATSPPPSADASDLRPLFTILGFGFVALVVVSIGLGWWIAGRFLRPLRTITGAARDISASNLHRRLDLRGRDEFADLAATLDELFERLEASFESQRHFVANASHELRTPLTAERALLQVALADPDATTDSLRATCRDLVSLSEHQERLIDALLTLASTERGIERREPVDLAAIAAHTVAGRRERTDVTMDGAFAAAIAEGDARLMESLVANLVDNALRHNVPGGSASVATSTVEGHARLCVENTGAVIPPAALDRLFEPFQRLEGRMRRTEGHGLGLAIVRAIATAHGATLTATARRDGGLAIVVAFPLSNASIASSHPERAARR